MGTLRATPGRDWVDWALRIIDAENKRSADTHLHTVDLPREWGVTLYLKDESSHRSGSLKHRLARSLFLFGLVNGWIRQGTTIVEASSGSTAVSEAYFAQLLGLPFVAVMTSTTSVSKVRLIEHFGGRCHFVADSSQVYDAAEAIARETGGHYMDQFTFAERATDWRGNNNIAESIFAQLELEEHHRPAWIVVGAGTGGTSATIGRYLRYHGHPTRLAVVDPENSAFYPAWSARTQAHSSEEVTVSGVGSRIEGIGRPRLEPSFIPEVIDEMFSVPDGASIAAREHLQELSGLDAGPSTGTNLWGVWQLVARMVASGTQGSIVSLMCDSASRYQGTYDNARWLHEQGLDPAPYRPIIDRFFASGTWG